MKTQKYFQLTILLFVSLHFGFSVCGQQKKATDSTRIISFVDKIIIKANVDTQTDSYEVETESGDRLSLLANNQHRFTLSLDYEFLGVSVGFAPKFLPGNDDNSLQGESSFNDYRFRFFLGAWTQELKYSRVQGFYVENTGDFIPNWIEDQDPFIQLPSFKTTIWGGSTSYILNPNFSLRNVVYNTEWQLKSAGSFIPTLRYGFTRISSKFNGPKTYQNDFDLRLAPDYYYTFVIHRNWFIAAFLSPSIGVRFANEGTEEIRTTENSVYWPVALDGGMQLGYSARKIIFGANFNFESTWYNESDNTHVLNDKIFAKIYFGYRLDAPKFIEKPFKSINKKLGL